MPRKILSAADTAEIQRRGRYMHNEDLALMYNVSVSHIKHLQSGIPKSPVIKAEAQKRNAQRSMESRSNKTWRRAFAENTPALKRRTQPPQGDPALARWTASIQPGMCKTLFTKESRVQTFVMAYAEYFNEVSASASGFEIVVCPRPSKGCLSIFTVPLHGYGDEEVDGKWEWIYSLRRDTCKTGCFQHSDECKSLSVAIARFNKNFAPLRGYRIGARYEKENRRATIYSYPIDDEDAR